ncbi:alpha-1,3/1,6-mannosyltransferase ALG2 [Cylas formicarius]|uniref:alpha-1,3/1,6-mannosyltransferase ALG2 n=1 Tax=Cylas formicarius TaxID=197179 RepID=UPI002958CFD2|nr:alpha-1,3/1,6-mannosyltransferase ALG2 [Cylas formicarius]
MVKRERVKIAFVHPDLGIGGAERLVLDIAGALKKQNYEIVFVTNHFEKLHAFDELKNDEFHVEVYGDWLPRAIFGRFQAFCAYIRMIYLALVYITFGERQSKPDLYFVDLIPTAIPFLKLTKKKVIYYCHHPDLLASPPGGILKKIYRKPIDWIEGRATAMSDVILVNSEYTGSVFRKTFPDIVKPIQILYPTIAHSYQEEVRKASSKKHITDIVPEINSKSKDLIIFLSLNRFHPAKRLEFAIDGMERLRDITTSDEWSKIFCIIAGGYDPQSRINKTYFNDLVALVNQKCLGDKIIFMKSPSDKVKVDLLKTISALLYTPLNEHFGIVPLEAMLTAKPVIAMNSGGPRETVDHGITGYLCEPTAESVAQFMLQIVRANPMEMGVQGRQQLEDKFSYNKFCSNLHKIVKEVTKKKNKISTN